MSRFFDPGSAAENAAIMQKIDLALEVLNTSLNSAVNKSRDQVLAYTATGKRNVLKILEGRVIVCARQQALQVLINREAEALFEQWLGYPREI